MSDVLRHWPAVVAPHTRVRDRLVEAYGAPGRGYHDLRHLTEVLDNVDLITREQPELAFDRDAVVLAAWFHDAVYDAAPDDVERSAVLAERELFTAGLPPLLVREVVRLVGVTGTHDPAEDDAAGHVLFDADLAILAAGPERYREYVAGVRREYSHLSDEAFRAGRAAILRALRGRRRLFHTDFALRTWEEPARANLDRELAVLETQEGHQS
jgi:predicted metal-dependent HD superfamily phosphohydrolase